MIKHTQRTPPFALQFVLLRCDLRAYWNPTDSGMNSFMSCCTGTRLQTCPERDASTEWRNPLLPAQVSWKCFKIGMRDQTVAQKGRFLPVIALYGWEGEHVSVEGSVRRAAPCGNASHSQQSKYHAFNRKARQLWLMSYLCRRGETSNRTAEDGQLRTASCESRDQQSTPKCVCVCFLFFFSLYTNKGQPHSDHPFLH